MSERPPSRRRRLVLVLAGSTAGAALTIGVPLAASAHVHVGPEDIPAGTTSTLTFTFQHGCDDSPTTALVFDVPDAVSVATPIVQGGWTIARELGDDGLPTRITYTADAPIEPGLKASVSMDVLLADETANTSVAFPITQVCVEGQTAWTDVADAGVDPETLEAPAPLVAVGAVAPEPGERDHGAAGDDHASTAGDDNAQAAAPGAAGDPVARGLAGAGLVAAVVALVRRRGARR